MGAWGLFDHENDGVAIEMNEIYNLIFTEKVYDKLLNQNRDYIRKFKFEFLNKNKKDVYDIIFKYWNDFRKKDNGIGWSYLLVGICLTILGDMSKNNCVIPMELDKDFSEELRLLVLKELKNNFINIQKDKESCCDFNEIKKYIGAELYLFSRGKYGLNYTKNISKNGEIIL